jgi:FkbM family methyltransferase
VIVTRAGREWAWPDADTKCLAVVFDSFVSLKATYPFLRSARTAIQAGGNMGAFPWKLAAKFAHVVTAEADPRCFAYLDQNVREHNVEKLNAAFSDAPGTVAICRPSTDNLGQQYIVPGNEVPAVRIDSLGVTDCDLIYLDIEGSELLALKGAAETIALSRPVIAIEDNGLSERFGTEKGGAGKWLARNFGYVQVAKSKRDVIYRCAL